MGFRESSPRSSNTFLISLESIVPLLSSSKRSKVSYIGLKASDYSQVLEFLL